MTQRRRHLHHRPSSPRQDPVADFLARVLMVLCGVEVAASLGLLVTGASRLVVVPLGAFTASALALCSRQIRRASRVRQMRPAAARYHWQ